MSLESKRKEKESGAKKVFREKIAGVFSNLAKDRNLKFKNLSKSQIG